MGGEEPAPKGGRGGAHRSAVPWHLPVSGSMAQCSPHPPGAPGGTFSTFSMAAGVFGVPLFLPVSICPTQAWLTPAAFASCFSVKPRLNRRNPIGLAPNGGRPAASAPDAPLVWAPNPARLAP